MPPSPGRSPLPAGSRRRSGEEPATDRVLSVALVLRSRAPEAIWASALDALRDRLPGEREILGRDEAAGVFGVEPSELEAVVAFARGQGLAVVGAEPTTGLLHLEGTVQQLQQLFAVELGLVEHHGSSHLSPSGDPELPPELRERVEGVFGLDQVPRFERPTRRSDAPAAGAGATYRAVDPRRVERAYRFPASLRGAGQRIAIVLLGGGFDSADLTLYFERLGLPCPSIDVIEVAGGANRPIPGETVLSYLAELGMVPPPEGGGEPVTDPDVIREIWWTIEATLDVELAGTFAPEAELAVYFAPDSELGKIAALSAAIADPATTVLSCSWGATEDVLHESFVHCADRLLQLAALCGITVCYSSGDHGGDPAPNGELRVQFPASSPHALACGGTRLGLGGGSGEIAWNEPPLATGGGFSRLFPRPDWQRETDPQGRGLPDVAGKADLAEGYAMVVGGQPVPMGGTSAVTPLWAGLAARLSEGLGCPTGWLTPLLYRDEVRRALQDITEGDNGSCSACPGWDPCTGLGSPDGERLLAALRADSGPSESSRR